MRCDFLFTPKPLFSFSLLALMLTVLLLPAVSSATTSFKIEMVDSVPLGASVRLSLDVSEYTPPREFAGFDLLIRFDGVYTQLDTVQPGQLLSDCSWEYFEYYVDPSGWVRIVAMAELPNGPTHPDCLITDVGQLATLDFSVTNRPTMECGFLPVQFYWIDCGDNGLTNEIGDTLFVSKRVFDHEGYELTDPWGSFPTVSGAPDSCLGSSNPPVRAADFYHGGIQLDCHPSLSGRAAQVMVDRVIGVELDQVADIPVNVYNISEDLTISAFDMLLQFNPEQMSFVDVVPGALIDSCQWEYFTFRHGSLANCDGSPCPDGVVRVVTVADVNNGEVYPDCLIEGPAHLFDLQLQVAGDISLVGQSLPIDFIWYDCGDNAAAADIGDTLFISRYVYDNGGFALAPDSLFPTLSGAPEECINQSGGMTPPVRAIDYHAGAVSPHPWTIDMRGDVNLNGISYEIADYTIFGNYFLYGLGVFSIDVSAQIATTDINADGLVLTLNDYIYFWRILTGNALPVGVTARNGVDTVVVHQDTVSGAVYLVDSENVSALWLEFDADIVNTSCELPDHDLDMNHDSSASLVLISPTLEFGTPLPYLPSGQLFDYFSPANIVSASGANDGETAVVVILQQGEAPGCCQNRGDINHDGSPAIDIADLVFLIDYMFSGGDEPPCMDEADIDNDGPPATISDIVYLVTYMFSAGPEPPPCD